MAGSVVVVEYQNNQTVIKILTEIKMRITSCRRLFTDLDRRVEVESRVYGWV